MSDVLPQTAPPAKHWTYADLERFDETERYEIYDGKLISMAPSQTVNHQRVLGDLLFLVGSFLQQHSLGHVVCAPLDVVFSEDNTAQPDLLFISNENAGIIKGHVFGAPDLTTEILSPSTITRDRYDKLEQYARFAVKEYWIIDPANRSVEILTLRNGRYEIHAMAVGNGKVTSLVLNGLEFEVAQLF